MDRDFTARTASGQCFNQDALTAAHPRLPLGTRAKVTNLHNGREVEVASVIIAALTAVDESSTSPAPPRGELGMGGSARVSIVAVSD